MDLLIFEVHDREDTYCAKRLGAGQVQRYRGTYSTQPGPGNFPEGHELFKALLEILETDEIHDLDAAVRIKDLLARYVPENRYEIVELTLNDARPEVGSRLIGYDVSICYHLSLVWPVFICWEANSETESTSTEMSEKVKMIEPLIDVTVAYFCEKLNADGLFSTYADAAFFLRCAKTLNQLCPNLWESQELMREFEVTGLYEVCLDGPRRSHR